MPKNIRKINEHELKECVFRKATAFSNTDEQRTHNQKLNLAVLLCNTPDKGVKIIFNTTKGYKEVLTAVWGSTEKFILLKGGSFIPTAAVAAVVLK